LEIPPFVQTAKTNGETAPSGFSTAFFTRMLFSCLKDADCLDTEAFLSPEKSANRGNYPTLKELKSKYDEQVRMKFSGSNVTSLNAVRNEIRLDCVKKALEPPGLFSLTVPTGGGKTLSSMAFAFEHALKYGFERIIYVIPYTSIIEQTARTFKSIFGNENVIEHHSNFEPLNEPQDTRDELENRRVLATENWDAPIIVTTNVQFFESLFHNKTSRVRKIHNIVRSVIILDEAQMLPVPLLQPTIEAIRELADHYRSSLVLCTATQPALNATDLKGGLIGVREIAQDPLLLERQLKRVQPFFLGVRTDEELVRALRSDEQALCIVNTRNHARLLQNLFDEKEGHFHLSALMCPQHRSLLFDVIRRRLKEGKRCRVVSTQLIEAGVDVDFPVVYRAIAGLDSIVQSAGRCNRENRMPQAGKVFVFVPESGLPKGAFGQTAQITHALLGRYGENFLTSEAVKDYFNELYWTKSLGNSLDEKRILDDCRTGEVRIDFPFKKIAEKYRLIEETMLSVVIPYDDTARSRIDELRSHGPSRATLRALQRYTVGIYPHQFAFLEDEGFIETVYEYYHILNEFRLKEAYSDRFGLNPSCKEFCDPESLCIG
jgi:CRISPR-associated helicase Cas3